jgi:hypothetical protein
LETTLSAPPQRVVLRSLLLICGAVIGFAASIFLGLNALILALAILVAASWQPVRRRIGDLWFAALGLAIGPVAYVVLGLLLNLDLDVDVVRRADELVWRACSAPSATTTQSRSDDLRQNE